MTKIQKFLSLDYGDARVGVALADSQVKIAIAWGVLENNEMLFKRIKDLVGFESIDVVVVGFPRNQSGEPTAQTAKVERFVQELGKKISQKICLQDESLTSVMAEERLKSYNKPYSKGDIDAMAAVIILEDFLEKL